MTSTDVPASSVGNAPSEAPETAVARPVPLTVTMLSAANLGPVRLALDNTESPVFPEASSHGGPGLAGSVAVGSDWPWKTRVISPASRKYQSLGRVYPSASSVSQ